MLGACGEGGGGGGGESRSAPPSGQCWQLSWTIALRLSR